ncbi:MAG: DUF4179 domain-containing protein [Oscillospiraceae bacterium]|nr:DUF4179 domain-containing protein [Oscillospiraceae bacterium]
MNTDKLIHNLGNIDEDLIAEAAELRTRQKRRPRLPRWAAAAACLVLVMSLAVTAEASTGAVSNLLAPLFGCAQTEIVDSIGIPVGASVSADGYTLTAEAIIGDRYNFAVVYSLTRDDGQPIAENAHFATWDPSKSRHGSGGGSLRTVPDEEDPSRMYFIEEWSVSGSVIGRQMSVTMGDLVIYAPDGEDIPLASGPWELTYTLRYEDSGKTLPLWNLPVTHPDGTQYKFKKLDISPVGLHLDFTILDPVWGTVHTLHEQVILRLKDGTELLLEGNGSYHHKGGGKTAKGSYSAMYGIPVPFEDMEALIICGTVYPLELTE